MTAIHPLPDDLAQRYHNWKTANFPSKELHLRQLADEGQAPPVMMISCSDSRVHATDLFGVTQGEFFMHRCVANLVPPVTAGDRALCTASALEYAITALHVSHVVVMGHSACGGVKGCHDMCRGTAPALSDQDSTVGRWIDGLRPAFERVKDIADDAARIAQMEKEGVLVSLENLMTYGFVQTAVSSGALSLHGLWTDIGSGTIEQYDTKQGKFVPL